MSLRAQKCALLQASIPIRHGSTLIEKRIHLRAMFEQSSNLCATYTLSNVHRGRFLPVEWSLDTSTLAQLMPLKAGASMPLLCTLMPFRVGALHPIALRRGFQNQRNQLLAGSRPMTRGGALLSRVDEYEESLLQGSRGTL